MPARVSAQPLSSASQLPVAFVLCWIVSCCFPPPTLCPTLTLLPPSSQTLQWLVVFVSLMMHVAAFLSMRFRARPCLIEDEFGNPLLDVYAIIT
jgi:hypothetical protein